MCVGNLFRAAVRLVNAQLDRHPTDARVTKIVVRLAERLLLIAKYPIHHAELPCPRQFAFTCLTFREDAVLGLLYGTGDGHRYGSGDVARIFRVPETCIESIRWGALRKLMSVGCSCWCCSAAPAVVSYDHLPHCADCYADLLAQPIVSEEETGRGRMVRFEDAHGIRYIAMEEWEKNGADGASGGEVV